MDTHFSAFLKNSLKIFPFTYLDKQHQNAHPFWTVLQKFLWKNLPLHSFAQAVPKCTPFLTTFAKNTLKNLTPHLFELGEEKVRVFSSKIFNSLTNSHREQASVHLVFVKYPSTCLKWQSKIGGCFLKKIYKIKNHPLIHRTERRRWLKKY